MGTTAKWATVVAAAGLLTWIGVRWATEAEAPDRESTRSDPPVVIADAGNQAHATPPSLQGLPTQDPTSGARSTTPPADSRLPFASGRVVGADGTPLAGVRLAVRGHESFGERVQEAAVVPDAVPLATTREDGTFRVQNHPVDLVSLVFLRDGYASTEVRTLSEDPVRNQDLRVVLERGRGMSGTVRDTEGRPIQGAQVSLALGQEFYQRNGTDAEGRYSFASLPESDGLRCMVAAAGYGPIVWKDASEWGEQRDFVLRREMLIVDVVDDPSGGPVPDAQGSLFDNETGQCRGYGIHNAALDEAGLQSPPERILFTPSPLGAIWSGEVHVFAPGHVGARVPVVTLADGEPPHLRVAMTPGGPAVALAGVVVGGPGARVQVRRVPPGGVEWPLVVIEATADSNGAFAIPGLPPDNYRLRAQVPGHVPTTVTVRSPALDIRMEPLRSGSVEVRVTSRGLPRANFHVGVESSAGPTLL